MKTKGSPPLEPSDSAAFDKLRPRARRGELVDSARPAASSAERDPEPVEGSNRRGPSRVEGAQGGEPRESPRGLEHVERVLEPQHLMLPGDMLGVISSRSIDQLSFQGVNFGGELNMRRVNRQR